MAFFLTHVWKFIQVAYPTWMVYIIREAQLSSRGGETGDEHEEHK
jgi:hypothetical protein